MNNTRHIISKLVSILIIATAVIIITIGISSYNSSTKEQYIQSITHSNHTILKNTESNNSDEYFVVDENENVFLLHIYLDRQKSVITPTYTHTRIQIDPTDTNMLSIFESVRTDQQ